MSLRPFANALVALTVIALTGCGVGRVVTAPVHFLFGPPEPTPVANTDVAHPGRPLPVPTATPRVATRKSTTQSSSNATSKPGATKKSASTSGASQFPTAKPVPGKPGLVFNPFKPNGGYIDVSGYASGSKVKDPDSQKIFIVP
jgi:hypothetical protein